MGRTPIIGHVIREFLPWRHMLTYLEAILRVYNRYGRRDNMYKARIKILVKALGAEEFARQVEAEWEHLTDGLGHGDHRRGVRRASPRTSRRRAYETLAGDDAALRAGARRQPRVRALGERNVHAAQGAGLRVGHAVAQEDRRAAGRRHRRADGRRRRPGRPLQLRRAARHARAEPGPRRRAASATCSRCGTQAQGARASRRRTSACSPTSSAARAATSARSPTPSRSRSPRRSSAASTTSTTCTTSASSTSTSPAA